MQNPQGENILKGTVSWREARRIADAYKQACFAVFDECDYAIESCTVPVLLVRRNFEDGMDSVVHSKAGRNWTKLFGVYDIMGERMLLMKWHGDKTDAYIEAVAQEVRDRNETCEKAIKEFTDRAMKRGDFELQKDRRPKKKRPRKKG
jgi:hypothetical protein